MKKILIFILCLMLVSCSSANKDNSANAAGLEYLNKMKEFSSSITADNLPSRSIDNYLEYTVRKGDTLSKIAYEYKTTVSDLARINHIENVDLIEIDQRLQIPSGSQSTVVDNERNPEFDAFLDEVFKQTMESDYMTMHFNVVDYNSFGIKKPEVNLGQIEYGFDEENFDLMKSQLDKLLSFDYDSLSYSQQYDYEALEYSLYETLASLGYYQYSFLFSSGSNLAENLISNFTDFTFYDEESVEDYLTCLEDIDRYFDDALTYTEAQSKDGYGPIDVWIDYTVKVCQGVLNKTDDNAFIVTFDERIDELSFIDDKKKETYKQRNRQIVLDEVLPSYEKVLNEIEKYRGKNKIDDYALYKFDKNYAELLFMLQGSNNEDIDTVFKQLTQHLSDLESDYISCYYDTDSYARLESAMQGENKNLNLVGRDCLEFLRKNLAEYYPDLGDISYDVQELDPDTAPASAIAYYWPSPIDNHNQNIIRTNPNNMRSGFETYGTLSHEGFPGHLYQHVFYYRTNPHNFRSAIGFIGYTEGWAVNAQKYAYRFSGIDDDYAAGALFFEDAYYFTVYSLVDIGVNYYGWSARDISKFFEEESYFFNFDNENAKYIREVLIEMPGVYCSYGIGSCNFSILEQYAKDALGENFDYVKYHEAVMKNGPLPFNILKTAVDEYINANR